MIHRNNIIIEDEIHTSDKDENEDFFDKERYRRFHSYRSIDQIETCIEDRKVLSCAYYTNEKKFYAIYQKKRKKMVTQMKLSNHEIQLCTCTFNVDLASNSTSKEITELSNRHSDYISVLMLPFEKTTENEEVKYYIISEYHFEFNIDREWILPNLYPVNINRDIQRTPTWSERSQCEKYINKDVIPLEGKYEGKVSSFRYKRGVRGKDTAFWTVKYTKISNTNTRRTYEIIEYSYEELIKIIL